MCAQKWWQWRCIDAAAEVKSPLQLVASPAAHGLEGGLSEVDARGVGRPETGPE